MNNRNIVIGARNPGKQARARQLRREMTPAETRLWKRLRTNQFHGFHSRRQQVIDGFIADFYCHAAGLVIEVDGAGHENQQEYDCLRDRVIAARGLCILRFPNDRIENEIEAVLAEILATSQSRLPDQLGR